MDGIDDGRSGQLSLGREGWKRACPESGTTKFVRAFFSSEKIELKWSGLNRRYLGGRCLL